MKILAALQLVTALALTTTLACLWDRDTLAEEASGNLEVIKVITGRFPRNPPIFCIPVRSGILV